MKVSASKTATSPSCKTLHEIALVEKYVEKTTINSWFFFAFNLQNRKPNFAQKSLYKLYFSVFKELRFGCISIFIKFYEVFLKHFLNISRIGDGGAIEAQNFNFAQKFNWRTAVEFITEPAILPSCCYLLPLFLLN